MAGAAASGLALAVGEAAGTDAGVELLHPPKNNVAVKTIPAVNDKDPNRMTPLLVLLQLKTIYSHSAAFRNRSPPSVHFKEKMIRKKSTRLEQS